MSSNQIKFKDMGCVQSNPIRPHSLHKSKKDNVSLSNISKPEPDPEHVSMIKLSPGECRFSGVLQASNKTDDVLFCPVGQVKFDADKKISYLEFSLNSQSWMFAVMLGSDVATSGKIKVEAVAYRNGSVFKGNPELEVLAIDNLLIVEDASIVLSSTDGKAMSMLGSLSWMAPLQIESLDLQAVH